MEIHNDPVPLRLDESGAIRVGNTRVLFYLVIEAYNRGDTPEDIVRMFEALPLADAYAVIAYYLRHKDEVETFLDEGEKQATEIRAKIEARQVPRDALREILEARRASMEKDRAASGQ